MDKAHKRPGMEAAGTRPTPTRPSPSRWTGVTMAVLGHRRSRRPQGLPLGAGRRDMEGGAPGDRYGPRAGRRRLRLAPLEEGPQAGGSPAAHQGKGLPHRLRRRAPGRRRPARRHGAASRQGASRPGGRRLPPLRQPRRGEIQGRPRAAYHARPGDAAPFRPRTLPQAERPGRPRGRLPLAPARGPETRRPWWSGPAPRALMPSAKGVRGGRAGGRHHSRGEAGRSASQTTCSGAITSTWRGRRMGKSTPHAPPCRTQDAGEGRGQGRGTPSSSSIPTPTWWPASSNTSPSPSSTA